MRLGDTSETKCGGIHLPNSIVPLVWSLQLVWKSRKVYTIRNRSHVMWISDGNDFNSRSCTNQV